MGDYLTLKNCFEMITLQLFFSYGKIDTRYKNYFLSWGLLLLLFLNFHFYCGEAFFLI